MRGKATKTREEVWAEVEKSCERYKIETPGKEFFVSEVYRLRLIDVSLPACPYVLRGHLGMRSLDIVVDENAHGIGRTPILSFVPEVIVIFGFAKFLECDTRSVADAWVGSRVWW